MFQRRRQQQQNTGVYLLAMHLLNSGPIPPVTLGAIVLQIGVFLGYIPFLDVENTRQMCLIPYRIISNGEWHRLIFPVIMHGSDMHLYYNMISLLYKGRKLEKRLGSIVFASILAVFSIASTFVTVAISYLLDQVTETEFMSQCAVGFSGVLFALKVLMNHYCPDANQTLFGRFPIPSKYACWVELILIELVTPNASFVGHLAGILTGLLYTYGPLQQIVKICSSIIENKWRHQPTAPPEEYAYDAFREESGNPARNRSHPSAPPEESDDESSNFGSSFTNAFSGQGATLGGTRNRFREYTGGLSDEEQLRRAIEESLRQSRSSRNYGWNL